MALAVILLWYFGLGVLAAIGTVAITRSRFSPRTEQRFYAGSTMPAVALTIST